MCEHDPSSCGELPAREVRPGQESSILRCRLLDGASPNRSLHTSISNHDLWQKKVKRNAVGHRLCCFFFFFLILLLLLLLLSIFTVVVALYVAMGLLKPDKQFINNNKGFIRFYFYFPLNTYVNLFTGARSLNSVL